MRDVAQLQSEGFKVRNDLGGGAQGDELTDLRCFIVTFKAPPDSAYEGYEFDVRFTLTEQFPFKSPSVGFVSRVLHPNIDEMSGSICLDSLNKNWCPAFSLVNIVSTQLPYLLQYPNPNDPFNRDAAAMMKQDEKAFRQRVKDHCAKYARKASS